MVFAVMQSSVQALDPFLSSPLIHYFLLFVPQGGTVFLEAKTFKAQEPTSEELAANLTPVLLQPSFPGHTQENLLSKLDLFKSLCFIPSQLHVFSFQNSDLFVISRFSIVWFFGYCFSVLFDLKSCEARLCLFCSCYLAYTSTRTYILNETITVSCNRK